MLLYMYLEKESYIITTFENLTLTKVIDVSLINLWAEEKNTILLFRIYRCVRSTIAREIWLGKLEQFII